jgi:hypothetical protein
MVGCGISLLLMIRFGCSNNYHKNWDLGLIGSIIMAPSFHVWLRIYGFHSIILVVLYQKLVVHSGYHVVSDLQALLIR